MVLFVTVIVDSEERTKEKQQKFGSLMAKRWIRSCELFTFEDDVFVRFSGYFLKQATLSDVYFVSSG